MNNDTIKLLNLEDISIDLNKSDITKIIIFYIVI